MVEPVCESFQTQADHIVPGDWFLPMTIKGVDQHDRISEAAARGAIGVTLEEGRLQKDSIPLPASLRSFSVPDLRAFLFEQARRKRLELQTRTVAIAGSVGKTSVKEILGHILKVCRPGQVHISPDNQNTKIALATQILRLPSLIETAVFEVGARRSGDFQIPLSFIQPEVVALLNIGTAHVGEFGSLEALQKEKLSILKASSARRLVISADNDLMSEFKNQVPTLSFGYSPSSDIQIVQESLGQTRVRLRDQEFSILHSHYQAPGSGPNVTAAIALALSLDLTWSQILAGLEDFSGTPRRFEMLSWKGMTAIDDAFNASPESMILGLRYLSQHFSQHKILLVLGSMLELGEKTQMEHEKVAELLMTLFNPEQVRILSIGEEARHLYKKLLMNSDFAKSAFHAPTAVDAKPLLETLSSGFDILYIKGSKAVGLQRLLSDL